MSNDSKLPIKLSSLPNLPTVVKRERRLPAVKREGVGEALQAYLREIRSHPRLSREEESRLAKEFYNNKDKEAAAQLITSSLWLVVKIAKEYERAAKSLLDLIQEGNIGLIEAVKNFDPYRGVRFASYASWWVKAYIIRYMIANWRMVKIGTTQAQRKLFFNLTKEKDRLEREGFAPSVKLLASKLQVKESEIIEMEQRLGSSDVSVDAPLPGSDGDASLLTVLPDDMLSPEDLLIEHESRTLLSESFSQFRPTLKEKERVIFDKRMIAEEKATLNEISLLLGVSAERVRQIEEKIKWKYRQFVSETEEA
jgi:RNA polymerase sigma-32 factor